MVFVEDGDYDTGLSGADSMGKESMVNKIGTLSLAFACHDAGIPCHILGGESKVLPFAAEDGMRAQVEEEGTMTLTHVFERIPFEMFDRWINERGVMDARKVGSKY